MKPPAASKGTYAFVSLGCPKNLVDSERMLGLLQLDGYRLVHEPQGADFVVRVRHSSSGEIRSRRDNFPPKLSVGAPLHQRKSVHMMRRFIGSGCWPRRRRSCA